MKQYLNIIKLMVVLLLMPVVCTALDSIGSFTATGKYGKISLSWINPEDGNYQRTDIVRKINSYPGTITDGVRVYSGTGSIYEDTVVVKDIVYYYAAFACDGANYATPATVTATPISDITPPSSPGTPTENFPDIDIIATSTWLLQWDTQSQDEESGIFRYEIEEKVDNGSWTLVQYISGDTGTASFSNKQPGRVYHYRLRAVNKAGLSGSFSSPSDGIRVVNKSVILPATASVAYAGQDGKFALVDVPTSAYTSGTIFGISQIIPLQTDLLKADPPIERLLGNAWQLVAVDGDNNLVQPASKMVLIMSYPDPDDATDTEDMERYRLYEFDKGAKTWRMVSGSQTIMGTNNMIQVAIGSISTFVVAKLHDIMPPEGIGSFTVAGSEHEVSLSWKNPVDVDFVYTMIVKRTDRFPGSATDGSVLYIGTGTGYVDATVTDSTTYYYAGFSWDGTNYSTATTGSATVKDNTPPAGVGSFTATGKMGKVEFSWNNPGDTDFGKVEILRSTIDFPATRTGYTPLYVGTGTMYVDTQVTNGITYYYTGFTYDRVGNHGIASYATATPGIDTPPSAPGTVTEGYFDVDVTIGTWTIFWGAATDEESGISSYELQQRINDGEWKTIGNVVSTGNVGNVYYHRVRAMNGNGMWGSYTVSDGIRVVNSAEFVQAGSLKWITMDGSGISMNVSGGTETGVITVSREVVGNLPFSLLGKAYRVAVINEANEETQPQGSITLTLFYPDPDSENEEADKGYRIYWLDNGRWRVVPGEQRVEPASNQITVTLSHLSVYAVGIPVKGIMVYPNPFNPGRYADHTKVIFKGWAGYAKIRIYKLNGELIEEMDGQDMREWVLSSDIASGVYIYVIDVSGGQTTSGKLAIIR